MVFINICFELNNKKEGYEWEYGVMFDMIFRWWIMVNSFEGRFEMKEEVVGNECCDFLVFIEMNVNDWSEMV